jgi:hypothetical protein
MGATSSGVSSFSGGGKGVDQLKSGLYRVRYRGTHVGTFDTVAAAEEAYASAVAIARHNARSDRGVYAHGHGTQHQAKCNKAPCKNKYLGLFPDRDSAQKYFSEHQQSVHGSAAGGPPARAEGAGGAVEEEEEEGGAVVQENICTFACTLGVEGVVVHIPTFRMHLHLLGVI